jgi:endonuclease VIII
VPEGDTIRAAAARLAPVLTGQTIVRATSRWPQIVDQLAGRVITLVEPMGKNLLLHVDDATTLRVHLGMNGRWRLLAPEAAVYGSLEHVALRLYTAVTVATCLDGRVERFRTRERSEVAGLDLGPDVMADGFDPAEAGARAQSSRLSAGEVLLDQRVACGIGNVWKCELLFLHHVDPFTPAARLEPPTWTALYADAHTRMRRQVALGGPRDTTGTGDHWVYARRRPCLRCGTRIRSASQGRDLPRTTWWCPRCQPPTLIPAPASR